MRILKGWTKKERKELEKAKDGGFFSAMSLIDDIVDGGCHALSGKYYSEDTNDSNQMAKDIVDFYCDRAKFPEQMYKVTLPDGSYLVKDKFEDNRWMFKYIDQDGYDIMNSTDCEDTFTEQEIKDIDSRYMAFAVPVEEN
ncbi:DUF1642 domain-containing protein [Companilactobacillus nodensis]|uniref:Uncharacterized protein n=1 Tax=Companilactobacillus nodensis DSM 19682 = JCM 14932 = NBRC 107160 TaxID=1423775 RepID=A0A0R1K9Q8_9LACO|nr:DUF1642 domain-containing protein [Companilactobacillus nodensis]KRK80107.1 hypothetical protein FD03_GL000289 [Companilactobacillus nodensis DSM 19682 = JCM 14932 = NBRC 107160]